MRRKVVTSIWLSGTGRYPMLQLPHDMAKAYGLDQACQIEFAVYNKDDDGILIKKSTASQLIELKLRDRL
jgi:hypothetical protein